MNRKKFLSTLRKKLSFLPKTLQEKEVLLYINELDKSKESDEDVIKSFGSMDTIINNIKKKYDYTEKSKIKRFYNTLVDIGTVFQTADSSKKITIIKDLLVLVFVTCILKLPFILLRTVGDQAIDVFMDSSRAALALWGLAIEVGYTIFALYYFIKTINKYDKNLKLN